VAETLAGEDGPRAITFQPDVYAKVLSLLPPPPARVLDVGAGQGYFSQVLKDRGYQVEACDYLEDNFKARGVPFHKADLNRKIGLPDDSYDVVVSVEVLEHLEDQFQFIREVLRVAKPGGLVVLTTPNILSFTSRWHFFLYGYTDCAPRPLDPSLEEYYMQHINPVGLDRIMFMIERFGGEMVDLATNHVRRGSIPSFLLLRPLVGLALRLKLMRRKYKDLFPVYRRHMKWMLHPANLLGRITIAVARKKRPAI
jgi:SAM-dependent methyltransferase